MSEDQSMPPTPAKVAGLAVEDAAGKLNPADAKAGGEPAWTAAATEAMAQLDESNEGIVWADAAADDAVQSKADNEAIL